MVVEEVDVTGVAIVEAENDAPIAGHRDRPQAREIAFQSMQPHAGKLAYIPDRPYVPERLSARELLSYVAGLYGLDAAGRYRNLPFIGVVKDPSAV